MTRREPSPIVDLLAKSTNWLRKRSLLKLLARWIPFLDTDPGIEVWACAGPFVALIALCLAPATGPLATILAGLAVVRLYEIMVSVTYIALFHGRFDATPLAGRRRSVVLLLANYAEFILWFAYFFFQNQMVSLAPLVAPRVAALAYSFSTASGVGSSPLTPTTTWHVILSVVESALGLFLIIAVLARFVGFLPRLPANDARHDSESHSA
jgi:hypothetical protein